MSEEIQKSLSAFMKSRMSKKSSKKKSSESPPIKTEKEVEKEQEKARLVEAKKESNSKLANVEKWAMYRRLIWEYVVHLAILLAYCLVFGIAMVKFGLVVLDFIKSFLHGIFVPVTK